MKILVLNSGSSSIKFQLFDMDKDIVIASGLVEQIGESIGQIKISSKGETIEEKMVIKDHKKGLDEVQDRLREMGVLESLNAVDGIGHRIVQGGDLFCNPELVDDRVISGIEELCPLGPLHNPAHLIGIRAAEEEAPNVPQVVVFDTAFHQTMPDFAYMYAIPYEMYEKYKIRVYGAHGTSHHYVAKEAAKHLNIPFNKFNAITLHLGNGSSATAIKNGESIDTSMGLTPLDGLIMGTRCGNLDPSVINYIAQKTGKNTEEINTLLNKESGLKGICGHNDARSVSEMVAKNDKRGILAFNMMAYRIKKYIGAYTAILGRVDALVFTGGIGENYVALREAVCKDMSHLGIILDEDKNSNHTEGIVDLSSKNSKVQVLRIPTNEEFEIAHQTKEIIDKL